jgi:hypothetical protein
MSTGRSPVHVGDGAVADTGGGFFVANAIALSVAAS